MIVDHAAEESAVDGYLFAVTSGDAVAAAGGDAVVIGNVANIAVTNIITAGGVAGAGNMKIVVGQIDTVGTGYQTLQAQKFFFVFHPQIVDAVTVICGYGDTAPNITTDCTWTAPP